MEIFALNWANLRHWIEMSLIMMVPISIAISWRNGLRSKSLAVAQLGFLLVWIFAALPVAWLLNLQSTINSNWFTVAIWAFTGVYQFSNLHSQFIASCLKIDIGSSFNQGARMGFDCLRACGPLMAAVFVTLPMSLAIMFGLTILMLLEFISKNGLYLSRAIGFASVIFALGFLFLSSPTKIYEPGGQHHHGSGG